MRSTRLELLGHELEAADQVAADGRQPAGQPAGRAATDERGHVDAEVLAVDVDQPLEAPGEERDLRRRGALLRREDAGGVDEARSARRRPR